MQAIVVQTLGGPEELVLREWPDPQPGPDELLVAVSRSGVNFMDTGARTRGPAGGSAPFIPGVEAVGRIVALGRAVTGFAVGDRITWVYAYGSYAELVTVAAEAAVPVPDTVSDDLAAAVMMQGLTAHHFATEAAPLGPGDIALVHSAAGGLGRLLTQLIRLRGARVIGLVSREEKVTAAASAGADEVLVSSGGDFVERVRALTDGQGVHAVYDGAGGTTFRSSMAATRRHGTVLYYGAFIDDVPVLSMRDIPNSIKVSYPVFRDHIPDRESLLRHSAEVFDLVAHGRLHVDIGRRYPLGDAAQAHRDIESRLTTGKLLLDVRP